MKSRSSNSPPPPVRPAWAPLARTLVLAAVIAWHAAAAAGETGVVVLSENAERNLGIEAAAAGPRTFEQTIFALGRIRVAPGRRAFVSSRIPGRALEVLAHVDTVIESGEPAVVLESRQPGDPPPTVTLRAPISGFVAAVNVAAGQPVSPDDALIEIVDLREVHAAAFVPEHLAGHLRMGQQARLRLPAVPGGEFNATLAHIAAEADAAAGTLEAAFHVANPELLLRPGMRAEFSIIVDSREVPVAIPREAIQGDLGGRHVFVRAPGVAHAYRRTPVVVGAENDRWAEILDGLSPGDLVVTRGAYSLAFAGAEAPSLRAALDAAHGHAHAEDGSELGDHDHGESGEDRGHDPDHDHAGHDDDHEDDRDPVMPEGFWTRFFAATTGLLAVLLALSLRRNRRGERHA